MIKDFSRSNIHPSITQIAAEDRSSRYARSQSMRVLNSDIKPEQDEGNESEPEVKFKNLQDSAKKSKVSRIFNR